MENIQRIPLLQLNVPLKDGLVIPTKAIEHLVGKVYFIVRNDNNLYQLSEKAPLAGPDGTGFYGFVSLYLEQNFLYAKIFNKSQQNMIPQVLAKIHQ